MRMVKRNIQNNIDISKNIGMERTFDTDIPILGITPPSQCRNDIFIPMLIAAIFRMAKNVNSLNAPTIK